MRTRFAILLFALFGSLSFARADVILSGMVLTSSSCSTSGTGSISLSLACGGDDPMRVASANGSANAFAGQIATNAFVTFQSGFPGFATASAELNLDGTYVLSGGVGMGTVDIGFFDIRSEGENSCEVTFNGASMPCIGGDSFVEDVVYGVPFSIGIDLKLSDTGINDFGNGQLSSYEISSQSGSLAAVSPEPSSLLLLMPGMAGVFFAVRSRGKKQSARAGTVT
jgi:hypothetical protein